MLGLKSTYNITPPGGMALPGDLMDDVRAMAAKGLVPDSVKTEFEAPTFEAFYRGLSLEGLCFWLSCSRYDRAWLRQFFHGYAVDLMNEVPPAVHDMCAEITASTDPISRETWQRWAKQREKIIPPPPKEGEERPAPFSSLLAVNALMEYGRLRLDANAGVNLEIFLLCYSHLRPTDHLEDALFAHFTYEALEEWSREAVRRWCTGKWKPGYVTLGTVAKEE